MQVLVDVSLILRKVRSRRLRAVGLAGALLAALHLRGLAERMFRYGRRLAERRRPGELVRSADLWDFLANREASRRGGEHHPDPLLAMEVVHGRRIVVRRRRRDGRVWIRASVEPTGLRLIAFLAGPRRKDAVLHADDHAIGAVRFRRTLTIPRTRLALSRGSITVHRSALDRFPGSSTLTLRVDQSGEHLLGKGNLDLLVPHGDGTILRPGFPRISSKGLPAEGAPPTAGPSDHEEVYVTLAELFRASLGKDLFLLGRTLRRALREEPSLAPTGAFDVGYLSELRCWRCVRDETIDVMARLAGAGFEVGVNHRGRPFDVSDGRGLGTLRLRVRPLWEMDGAVHGASGTSLLIAREQLLPVRSVVRDGRAVLLPNEAEALLTAASGPGRASTRRLRLSLRDVARVNERLAAQHTGGSEPDEGPASVPTIRAHGLVPLYPLEERVRALGL